ncbi:MAG TPA: GAF domain-containing protein, partial [Candidatus Saccharimonadales bacterium]|nr:GAF domain-containing protein [Candidatus Saccharimonadales bacterium]
MSNPSPSPQNIGSESYSYSSWRERFLQVVLQGTSVLGFLAIVLYLFTPTTTALKLVAVLMFAALVFVSWFIKLPYSIRVGVFLLLLYVAGFSSLIDYGVAQATVLFLGFIVMTGLLLPTRSGVYYAVGISLFSILIIGNQGTTFLEWLRAVGIFLVIAVAVAIGLRTAVQDFLKIQGEAREMLETLLSERFGLEQRIDERTAGLTQKTEQLRATSYIARKTAEVQDLDSLLNTVAKLVSDQFGFYHTGIYLLNEAGNHAVLQAASSDGGRQMIEQGYSITVGSEDLVGAVAMQKKPRFALDIGEDPAFFNNPRLPMTRSEAALPLIVRNKVLGVMDIQSDKPQAFGPDDIDILQTLADQIAIAIENARLMDETQAALMQLEALTGLRTR